jgi:hypothetical protein
MEKYRVTLDSEERALLEAQISSGVWPAREIIHARILLLSDANSLNQSDEQIAKSLLCHTRTINRVRRLFVIHGLDFALKRQRQPPRPDRVKFKGDLGQMLIQLACSDPPEGRSHWTLELLGDRLVALGLVNNYSRETIRLALKKTTSNLGL